MKNQTKNSQTKKGLTCFKIQQINTQNTSTTIIML